MVTHDPRIASFADKIIRILDGQIQSVDIITDITSQEQVAASDLAIAQSAAEISHLEDEKSETIIS